MSIHNERCPVSTQSLSTHQQKTLKSGEDALDQWGKRFRMNKMKTRKNRIRFPFILTVAFVGVMIMACNLTAVQPRRPNDQEPTPVSTISLGSISGTVWEDVCDNPTDAEGSNPRCVFDAARELYLANGILEDGEPGLADVEVQLGKGLCPSQGLDAVMSFADGSYTFENLSPGDYCITVDFPAVIHQAKPISGVWTYPKSERGTGVGSVTVSLSPGEKIGNVNFGWDYLFDPSDPEPEPTITPTPRATCTNKAAFITDVTVPDGERFPQGEDFSKVWRLKNVGTCSWDGEYALIFADGDQMSGHVSQPLGEDVSPGSEIDIGVGLVAPESDGSYKGYWMLQSDDGNLFGIGTGGDKPFWVKITVGQESSSDSVVSWTPELNPENLSREGRWVDVDLGQQMLTAYEGSTPVMRFIVSTGTASHPTVTGQFRIWVKLEATDMSGPGYSLKDVPFTMYFYQGYGLHGTYWHNNFGTPMSHGCVNLETTDAAWLFDFVSTGTLVNIHA